MILLHLPPYWLHDATTIPVLLSVHAAKLRKHAHAPAPFTTAVGVGSSPSFVDLPILHLPCFPVIEGVALQQN